MPGELGTFQNGFPLLGADGFPILYAGGNGCNCCEPRGGSACCTRNVFNCGFVPVATSEYETTITTDWNIRVQSPGAALQQSRLENYVINHTGQLCSFTRDYSIGFTDLLPPPIVQVNTVDVRSRISLNMGSVLDEPRSCQNGYPLCQSTFSGQISNACLWTFLVRLKGGRSGGGVDLSLVEGGFLVHADMATRNYFILYLAPGGLGGPETVREGSLNVELLFTGNCPTGISVNGTYRAYSTAFPDSLNVLVDVDATLTASPIGACAGGQALAGPTSQRDESEDCTDCRRKRKQGT